MRPAEVIAMRDKLEMQERLADEYAHVATDWEYEFSQFQEGKGEDPGPNAEYISAWLIESGWVVAPPKNEGENDDSGY